jgi:hypothetical protein
MSVGPMSLIKAQGLNINVQHWTVCRNDVALTAASLPDGASGYNVLQARRRI